MGDVVILKSRLRLNIDMFGFLRNGTFWLALSVGLCLISSGPGKVYLRRSFERLDISEQLETVMEVFAVYERPSVYFAHND